MKSFLSYLLCMFCFSSSLFTQVLVYDIEYPVHKKQWISADGTVNSYYIENFQFNYENIDPQGQVYQLQTFAVIDSGRIYNYAVKGDHLILAFAEPKAQMPDIAFPHFVMYDIPTGNVVWDTLFSYGPYANVNFVDFLVHDNEFYAQVSVLEEGDCSASQFLHTVSDQGDFSNRFRLGNCDVNSYSFLNNQKIFFLKSDACSCNDSKPRADIMFELSSTPETHPNIVFTLEDTLNQLQDIYTNGLVGGSVVDSNTFVGPTYIRSTDLWDVKDYAVAKMSDTGLVFKSLLDTLGISSQEMTNGTINIQNVVSDEITGYYVFFRENFRRVDFPEYLYHYDSVQFHVVHVNQDFSNVVPVCSYTRSGNTINASLNVDENNVFITYLLRNGTSDSEQKEQRILRIDTHSDHPLSSFDTPIHDCGFEMYPNPARAELIFNVQHKGRVDFYTITGQVVHTLKVQQETNTISLSNLKTGAYFVKFTSAEGSTTTQSLIIQR